MKRNLAIILLTCILVSCLALFAACNTNAHTHTIEKVDAKAATCLTEGNEEYYRCTGCDKLFSDEGVTEITAKSVVIAALGHDEDSHDAKAATCTEDGWNAYVTCKREGCDYTTKVVIPAAHTEVIDEAKAPTCTETGLTEGKHCSACNEVIVAQQTVDALKHDYDSKVTTEPTCTKKGVKTYTCKREGCKDTYTEDVDELGHDDVKHDGKPATCTEEGYEAYVTCSRCDYTTYKKIDKIPHVYDQEVVDEKYLAAEATVTSAATYYKSCVCGAKGTETFTHGDPLTPDPEQIKIEAETGVLTGTPMYGVASMVESSVLASGGQELGCFCNNGNTATWTVTLNESHEDATLSFSIKSWATTEDMSGVKITVNGEELAWRDGEKFKATDVLANVYKLYHSAKFSVSKGELVIKIEIIDNTKANCNFDYLTVNFTEISLEDTSPDPREDAYAVKAEAEHAVISGTSQIPWLAPDMIESTDQASGGKEIGCFGVNDNTAQWKFNFAENAENVVVYFYAKSFIDGSTENFGIYVDDVELEWFNEYFSKTTGLANPYKFYASKSFNLTSGIHTVTLKVLDASDDKCAVNFDYIMLAGYGNVEVVFDNTAPVIANIEVDKTNVGEESNITYTVSDNVTAVDDITVSVKVYFDYQGENQEQVVVTNGKFTPTKDGFYSVVITATDEFGNITTEFKSFAFGTLTDPGTIKIEAETANIVGTSQYAWVTTTMIESIDAASGCAEIGCFAVNGNTATWRVTLYENHENATLNFTMRSFIDTEDMSGFKVTVNGVEISWGEGVKLANTTPNYADYSTAKFSAEAGELVITIEVADADKATANIDYLTINLA